MQPRVLLVSEAANPEMVSVPLEGWSLARALARVADVHLVTQVRNRDALARAGLVEGEDFTAIDSEAVARPAYRLGSILRGGRGKGWTLMQAVSAATYPYFEHLAWRHFRRRIEAGEFDLVHRHVPISPTVPSLLAGRCRRAGVPFVLGPLNGGLPWPPEFDAARRLEKEWLAPFRAAHRLLPGHRGTRRDASAIIAGSADAWGQFAAGYADKLCYVPENGIEPGRFAARRDRPPGGPVRAAFVGRLVPYKGADMLLEAAAPLVREGRLHVQILGDGPQMPQLREIARREGIEAGVDLPGWVAHDAIAGRLAGCDLLAFPSVREFGGAVVLEAMAVGLVPVVVAYGGPGELATPATGYLIPLGPREQIISDLRRTLAEIVADPARLAPKARAAVRRVETLFTWDAKAAQVLEVYRWVLGRRPDRPALAIPLPDETADAPE